MFTPGKVLQFIKLYNEYYDMHRCTYGVLPVNIENSIIGYHICT